MASAPDLLTQYGLAVVFAWAFAVQAGAPAPAVPMLLGAGALSGAGRMHLALAIAAAMAATLAADVLWYWLGRVHGTRVLALLCRVSLDADSLIRSAKERFVAHRLRYLVLAKFLPGANPLAAGLAGAVPIALERFVLYAAAGALLWAGAWMTLGYICADVITLVATAASRLGTPLVIVIAAALVLYLAYKFERRQRFLRHLRKARITPMELKRRLDAGDHPVIFDLRTALDIELIPYGIPGARWIPVEAQGAPPGPPRLQECASSQGRTRGLAPGRIRRRTAARRTAAGGDDSMSSKAETYQPRTTRKRKTNVSSAIETSSRRNGRVRATQPRRTSVRRSRTATRLRHARLGWYVGVAAMAVIEIIEWPLAIVMMVGHEIAHHTHRQALRDFAEGIEAGA